MTTSAAACQPEFSCVLTLHTLSDFGSRSKEGKKESRKHCAHRRLQQTVEKALLEG